MKLYVHVFEAQDLPLYDSGSGFGSYVKVKFGKSKRRTRVLLNDASPRWNEEFVFRVDERYAAVVFSVYRRDEDYRRYVGSLDDDLIGRVKVPIRSFVGDGEDRTTTMMPPTWFTIERLTTWKLLHEDSGKILLSISLHGNFHERSTADIGEDKDLSYSYKDADHKTRDGKELAKAITRRLEKIFAKDGRDSRTSESLELSGTPSDYNDSTDECCTDHNFEETISMMQSRDSGNELPENLSGGILIDQIYKVQPRDMNIFLFSPNSKFRRELAELEGMADVEEEPWVLKLGNGCRLMRKVSYMKAATKLVKAVRATENQAFLKADGKNFAIFIEASTPEVPYGDAFQVELLYKLMPGPELASGVESTHLIVSWGVNFYRSVMIKGMIERGARKGLKESFDNFVNLLEQNFPALEPTDQFSNKDRVKATLENELRSDWKRAVEYLLNVTVFTTTCLIIYLFVHISLCKKSAPHGLEFNGLDLPDSLTELVVGGIIFLQLERAYYMASHFLQARRQRGTGHKAKAQGDGWVLTVALIEGTELASSCMSGLSDPYVVFTCNGKTRMSHVKLQTTNPRWNEILEFDTAEEPPSVLDVEVFDFDSPFSPAKSLGYAEINFLKHTPDELADMWVFLDGKLARSSLSKLHLRIFLDNNNGAETIREYLAKMEKEVGKKLNLQSPHRNSTFQKVFRLPEDEFLIGDFACCSLKRKIPLQGRIFLSARVVGFYSNLFGHKTRFFFLWEDIDNIQVLPPSLFSVGSPSLVIILQKDCGLDAQHGAKSRDEEGRLKFYFQSFSSFHDASRTIMALWRTRNPNAFHKPRTVEEHSDHETLATIEDNTVAIMDIEDVELSKMYSAELPIEMNSFMELFRGGDFERRIMERSGCLDYGMTEWIPVRPGALERSVSYKLDRHISTFGGEVTSTQQKVSNDDGWIVNEVTALHNIPFADHFRVHTRYQIGESTQRHGSCCCEVYMGISWRKNTKFHSRIARNVTEKLTRRLRHLLEQLEQEVP